MRDLLLFLAAPAAYTLVAIVFACLLEPDDWRDALMAILWPVTVLAMVFTVFYAWGILAIERADDARVATAEGTLDG